MKTGHNSYVLLRTVPGTWPTVDGHSSRPVCEEGEGERRVQPLSIKAFSLIHAVK